MAVVGFKKVFIGITLIFSVVVLFAKCEDKVDETEERIAEVGKRGIVLYPSDLMSLDANWWVDALAGSGLNVLGIHTNTDLETISDLETFLKSEQGKNLVKLCAEKGIAIEYECHVLQDILPRELFKSHPEYFRADKQGIRQQQYNMCFSSEGAYQEIEKNIHSITEWLKPTSHRYLFWTDDVQDAFCHCEKCEKYSASEQALLYENRLLEILRKIDQKATVAHLAYNATLKAPEKVKPLEGVFLEYAPIKRGDFSQPLSSHHVQSIQENFEVFPKETAHILEYWLDASLLALWNRDHMVEIPWNIDYCSRDVELYKKLGITSITTFGTWINQEYIKRFGETKTQEMIREYGSVLKK